MSLLRARKVVTDPRVLALTVLGRMEVSSVPVDGVFDDEAAHLKVSGVDRALAQEITYGVLRWKLRLDAIASQYAPKGLPTDPRVRIVLRAGVYQLVFLDRIPASAAVNTSVEAAKALGRAPQSGFVNAVLRRVSEHANEHREQPPPPASAPLSQWAEYTSFTEWMAQALRDALDSDEEAHALLTAMNEPAPLTLRARDGDGSTLATQLREVAGAEVEASAWLSGAVRVTGGAGPVTALPGFAEGRFVVQDEAAQLVVHLMDPAEGEKVLDVGAAPGGKSFHIADRIGAHAVTGIDVHPGRMERMRGEAERLGLGDLEHITADLIQDTNALSGRTFDRVLVDAPCSALGIIRRKPDVKWSRTPEDIPRLAAKQAALLAAAARYVAPGGSLWYSVCTLTREETTGVADALPAGDAGLERMTIAVPAESFRFHETDFRSLPHKHGTDGFYVAAWRKSL